MNILISVENLEPGGAQYEAIKLASLLAEKDGHNVYLYSVHSYRVNFGALAARLSPKVSLLSLRNERMLNFLIWKLSALLTHMGADVHFRERIERWYFRHCIKRRKIAVVHSQLIQSDIFCVRMLRHTSVPVVITKCTVSPEDSQATDAYTDYIFAGASAVIAVSEFCKSQIQTAADKHRLPLVRIYNAIPLEKRAYNGGGRKQLGISPAAFVFGMVSRGIAEKGWEQAIESFAMVLDRTRVDVHLVLVGAGPDLDALERRVDNRLADRIHFTGHAEEPGFWIESFDVGLLPSYFSGETLGVAVMEYLLYGKPAVVTDYSGLTEVIASPLGNAGFLVALTPEGKADAVEMARCMTTYLTDPEVYREHKNRTAAALEKFDEDLFANAHVAVFAKAIESRKNMMKGL
jgi:glycosyltransferase involved in cell wall biosynthesis